MNTNDISVTQHIRDLLSTSEVTDPASVAEQMIEGSTAATRKEWLAAVLPSYVASVMRADRNTALNHVANPRRTPSASAKVAGIRDWWTKFIESRIAVGDHWKAVGDLDADDLASVALARREQAAKLHTQADRYETLIGLLADHGVAVVRELPSDVVLATGLADAA